MRAQEKRSKEIDMRNEKMAQTLIKDYNRIATAECVASLEYHYMKLDSIAHRLDELGYEIIGTTAPYTIKRR